MVKEFNNQWAIILGGSTGLGYASALKLAQHGMNICIIHRNSRAEMETILVAFDEVKALGISFLHYNLDVTSPDKIKFFVDDFKTKCSSKVKVMLHSIAKGALKSMTSDNSLSNEDLNITMNAMAFSLYDWTKALHQNNLLETDARILAFTSEGNTKPIPNYGAVSAAKVALESISRQIAIEFAPFEIRSNCIQAGVTQTKSFQMIPNHENISAFATKRNPYKRLTVPEDVANVVYLLCKPESSWINGTIIKVDGGESLQ